MQLKLQILKILNVEVLSIVLQFGITFSFYNYCPGYSVLFELLHCIH